METWSSCMAELGIESTDAGTASRLSSDDDRGLGVLGDHVAGVDAGVVGEERRQAVRAGHVEHPVGAALGHARDVGDRDGEEVQHVGDRRAVEVAVGLDPAVRQHDRVVDGGGQLTVGDGRGVRRRCPARRRAPAASSAASRRPARGCSPGRGGWPRSRSRARSDEHPRGGHGLAGVRAQRVQVGREDAVGAEQRLDAHRGGEVGDVQQPRRGRRSPAPACRACRRCR